jgi:hypothetical protein
MSRKGIIKVMNFIKKRIIAQYNMHCRKSAASHTRQETGEIERSYK